VRGVDLATEWRRRRWRKLLNLIDHLPRDTAYVDAVADDELVAEAMADQPDPPVRAPRMATWSPEVELLTALLDRVAELIHVVAMTAGAKPGRRTPAPRPVTALDRVRQRRRETQHQRVVAKLLPHKTHPSG
jgi:hypothetical protein